MCNDNISSAGQRTQCKLHTFRVLSQDFGGKSKQNGGHLVTRLLTFWMYVSPLVSVYSPCTLFVCPYLQLNIATLTMTYGGRGPL